MMTSWVGGVEEAGARRTEGGVEAWDASERGADLLLAEARQTSENLLTVSDLFILRADSLICTLKST